MLEDRAILNFVILLLVNVVGVVFLYSITFRFMVQKYSVAENTGFCLKGFLLGNKAFYTHMAKVCGSAVFFLVVCILILFYISNKIFYNQSVLYEILGFLCVVLLSLYVIWIHLFKKEYFYDRVYSYQRLLIAYIPVVVFFVSTFLVCVWVSASISDAIAGSTVYPYYNIFPIDFLYVLWVFLYIFTQCIFCVLTPYTVCRILK